VRIVTLWWTAKKIGHPGARMDVVVDLVCDGLAEFGWITSMAWAPSSRWRRQAGKAAGVNGSPVAAVNDSRKVPAC
jgi:hypothetical protein